MLILLPATHALALAACAGLFGTWVFRLAGLPHPYEGTTTWRRLLGWTLTAALASHLAWLVLQTAEIADSESLAGTWEAIPTVLMATHFGWLFLGRLAGLALMLIAMMGHRDQLGLAASLGLLLADALIGHPFSVDSPMYLLTLSVALHSLAAGLWLGQLPALWLFIGTAETAAVRMALQRFTPFGITAVALLAVTASVQFRLLAVGGSEIYLKLIAAKSLLFVLLLGLACLNRFVLLPALSRSPARLALRLSVLAEMMIGVAALYLACRLGATPFRS